MSRLYYVIALGLSLAACTTDPTTSQTDQAAWSGDCYGDNNFPKVKMTEPKPWDGSQPPIPTFKQVLVITQLAVGGDYLVALADLGAEQVVWARVVDVGKIGNFYAAAGPSGRIFGGRIPPVAPPGGSDWLFMGRWSLEQALRLDPVLVNSFHAAGGS